MLQSICLDKKILADFESAIKREWIVTNGLGGYASSTILGINTRKYHGLLVSAFNPPRNRHVLIEKFDEELILSDRKVPLYSNEFQHGISPNGSVFLEEFRLDPFPKFKYRAEGVELVKTIFMPYRKNAVIVVYKLSNPHFESIELNVYPRLNLRHIYHVTDHKKKFSSYVQKFLQASTFLRCEKPRIFIAMGTREGGYSAKEEWVEKVFYRIDSSRFESSLDDYFQPGKFTFKVKPGEVGEFSIVAVGSTRESDAQSDFASLNLGVKEVEKLLMREIERKTLILNFSRRRLRRLELEVPEEVNWLILSADSFMVSGRNLKDRSIIAGYHWFEDWGRDALISLPGLALVTGRVDDARKILLFFAKNCRIGLIPNYFTEKKNGDKAEYNSVDSSLWFLNAVFQFLKYAGDRNFVRRELWKTMRDIIHWYVRGTDYGIILDKDGLLRHGPRLTWMDAAINGKPVTPRGGKAVEIQALWYNGLRIMELLAEDFREMEEARYYRDIAENLERIFREKFWNSRLNYLNDVISENGSPDCSLRPNQIIAVSLDFSMLSIEESERVVEIVWKKLVTPYGLRTLSNENPQYHGKYCGDWNRRNLAYHNGTVWPWLLGPFVTAFLKVKGRSLKWRTFAYENFLRNLFTKHTFENGLGTISEIFDGDPPHKPDGCISQAWSVAEPLRAYFEDVLLRRPPFEAEFLS